MIEDGFSMWLVEPRRNFTGCDNTRRAVAVQLGD